VQSIINKNVTFSADRSLQGEPEGGGPEGASRGDEQPQPPVIELVRGPGIQASPLLASRSAGDSPAKSPKAAPRPSMMKKQKSLDSGPSSPAHSIEGEKRKKSFFSKSKNIFKKLGHSKS